MSNLINYFSTERLNNIKIRMQTIAERTGFKHVQDRHSPGGGEI